MHVAEDNQRHVLAGVMRPLKSELQVKITMVTCAAERSQLTSSIL
jgi:hypothetical protein